MDGGGVTDTGERVRTHSFSNCQFYGPNHRKRKSRARRMSWMLSADFLTLGPRGVEYVCLCPFHDDKTLGQLSRESLRRVVKCFACGAGGDAIKFLMEYKGSKLSYGEALHYLEAKKYSIPLYLTTIGKAVSVGRTSSQPSLSRSWRCTRRCWSWSATWCG